MATHVSSLARPSIPAAPAAAPGALARLALPAGRLAFALPFAVFGLMHFPGAEAMAPMVPVPGGVFWIYLTGVAMIAASIGIITGKLGQWAALGLAALMLTFSLAIHLPGLGAEATRQMSLMSLLKDVSLMGGALTWAALLARPRS